MDGNRIRRKAVRHIGRTAFGCACLIYPLKWLGMAPEFLSGWWVLALLGVTFICYQLYERMMRSLLESEADTPLDSYEAGYFVDLLQEAYAEKPEDQPDETITVFPWVAWSEQDTVTTRQLVMSVFDKEPSALDSSEAGSLLEILESGRDDKGGMFMTVEKSIAESLEQSGSVSMDPAARDTYGRQRLPEIAKEIGLAEEVIGELGWGWS